MTNSVALGLALTGLSCASLTALQLRAISVLRLGTWVRRAILAVGIGSTAILLAVIVLRFLRIQ